MTPHVRGGLALCVRVGWCALSWGACATLRRGRDRRGGGGEREGEERKLLVGRRQARFFGDKKERGDHGGHGKLLFRAQFLLNKILSFGRGSLPGYTLDVACGRCKGQNHSKKVDFGQIEGEIRNQHRRITPLQGA